MKQVSAGGGTDREAETWMVEATAGAGQSATSPRAHARTRAHARQIREGLDCNVFYNQLLTKGGRSQLVTRG